MINKKLVFILSVLILCSSFSLSYTQQDNTESPSNFTTNAGVVGLEGITGEDYELGPYDSIAVNLTGLLKENYQVIVSPEGEIFLPVIGKIKVADLNLKQVKELLEKEYAKYYQNFKLSVSLVSLRTIKIYVLGMVNKPGSYTVSSLSRISDVLSSSGLLENSSLRRIKITRGSKKIIVDYYDFTMNGEIEKNIRVKAGDIIYVSVAKKIVTITGAVNKAGSYELIGKENLYDLIKFAQSFNYNAITSDIRIERKFKKNNNAKTYNINWESKEAKNFSLKTGDVVIVPSELQYQKTIKILGEIKGVDLFNKLETSPVKETVKGEAGKEIFLTSFLYHLGKGEKILDIITNCGGVTPNAFLEGVYVYRKEGQDIKKVNINLQNILIKGDLADNIELQPGDILVIPPFEKYIYVLGEVATPGSYPFEPGRNISHYLGLAGGYGQRAVLEKLKIIRRKNGKVIQLTFNYAKFIKGDLENKEPNLEAGDTLVIPRTEKLMGIRDYLNLIITTSPIWTIFLRK